ncbi:MAG: T9SS type A sorting domain-containing protein [Bacteroidales bacterium]|nr:T9SS type A sorting domain-containing protein [Bacteroidales bacterium]
MLKTLISIFCCFIIFYQNGSAQQAVTIGIDAASEQKPISLYIYAKNNSLSDNSGSPLNASEWQRLRDLGIRMYRENGGNNSTKYNWRRKLSSHPDWYNNVFPHDWGYAAQSLQQNIPSAQGMWAFQLIGKAAKTNAYNFSSWDYNQAKWWEGVRQNLCGGGEVNPDGGEDALVDGDPGLYLEDWTADSTAGILDHWFGEGGRGLDSNRIRYWNMDNEPEIWEGTHDDVWPVQPSAEAFMQMYFSVAKKARAKFPGIKLVGPVPANEWQWYNYKGSKINYDGRDHVWLEYFIRRVAEEQEISGIRLLDVLDIHFYPGETAPEDIVQLHRVYFDMTYDYPGANGVKRTGPGSWDNSITKEYIFMRCQNWLEQYMGPDHGVAFSVTETGINSDDPDVTALWYASTLGEFARQGVEIFTPWSWKTGMDEVIHLFSRYGQEYFIGAASSEEEFVSAYPTINGENDSITIFVVNRHTSQSKQSIINLNNYPVQDGTYDMYSLSDLPQNETFISHSSNALEVSGIELMDNRVTLDLPPLSVHALILTRAENFYQTGYLVAEAEAEDGVLTGVTIGNSNPGFSGSGYVTGFDQATDKVTVTMVVPETDIYRLLIRYNGPNGTKTQDVIINDGFSTPVRFPETDSFEIVDAGSYLLETGSNTFTVRKNWGWTDIDKFMVYTSSKNIYDIAPDLVDSAATENTEALYELLRLQFGKRIISGQTHGNYADIKNLTGKSPLLRVGDFQHFTEGYPYLWVDGEHTFGKDDDGSVDALIDWYNSTEGKGIISYQWHWHSPSGGSAGTNTFYTNQTTFDITLAVTPGTQEYDDIIRDIDDIAAELKKFQDAGIPILWRPLHEAGGGWFWWGAKGPEPCKELYNIMFDRLKNHHQLHNLIWVWSTPEEDWYPGNNKVDIIGHDSYPGEYNYGTQKYAFDVLYRLTQGKKLIAMTENGPIPEPGDCLAQEAPWLFFMSWSNLVFDQNSDDHIKAVYNNPNVLTLESHNFVTSFEWRSALYPENWKPGYKDTQGRFLHDFSYAGYHQGETEIPYITQNIVNITQSPYSADNTGIDDVTAIIQQALDEVGASGGGVVYLPAGTYRIKTPSSSDYGLHIKYDSIILRGAGVDSTFLFHDETFMRQKDIIHVRSDWSNWFSQTGTVTQITADLTEPTRIIPVHSVAGFNVGDHVIVTSSPTEQWIEEHQMAGIWTADAVKGVAFMRRIDSINAEKNLLIIDVPTRYFLKTRDSSRVYHAGNHISECGIEHLSIGNKENPKTGWEEESYNTIGTGAYDVHFSHAIQFKYAQNCWVNNVHTYKPPVNSEDIHVLSNCLLLDQCRNITIDSCYFQKPQYEGGGGNGYMYTLQSNDCLISNSRANHSRHNYDFKYPYSNGNVIHNCRGENSKYSSDFHMYLSMSNLFDVFTINGDYLESTFRPYGGSAIHGYSSTQSVFYNTEGEAYHPNKNYIIESRQLGWGYVIGTSGPSNEVLLDPISGSAGGYSYNTTPRDFLEGVGKGEDLRPWSLYLDQLDRRLSEPKGTGSYNVNIIVKEAGTGKVIPGCNVEIYDELKTTDGSGRILFNQVPESFLLNIDKEGYFPYLQQQKVIFSDTTLTVYLSENLVNVTMKLLDSKTNDPFWGVNVTIGSDSEVTNTQGEAFFTLPPGPFDYQFHKTSFQEEQGTLTITSDTTILFYLIRTHGDVKFNLTEDITPVNNALVVVNGDSVLSNAIGLALFDDLPIAAYYSYLITKDGYEQRGGDFFLETDTTIQISMQAIQNNTEGLSDRGKIKFWPNPVHDLLYLNIPETFIENTIRITDITGNDLYNQKNKYGLLRINVMDYPAGVYIINIYSNESQTSHMFIKK